MGREDRGQMVTDRRQTGKQGDRALQMLKDEVQKSSIV